MKITPKQSFAIFCKTKVDVRGCDPTKEEIDLVFKSDNVTAFQIVSHWPGIIVKGEIIKPKQDFSMLYVKAHEAGLQAVEELYVIPMIIQEHKNLLNDNSPVKQSYFVSDGVCGFSAIIITPGNCAFANWLKKNNMAKSHYGGGVSIWVYDFNQSYQKKVAYAAAFATCINQNGIKAHVWDRLD